MGYPWAQLGGLGLMCYEWLTDGEKRAEPVRVHCAGLFYPQVRGQLAKICCLILQIQAPCLRQSVSACI